MYLTDACLYWGKLPDAHCQGWNNTIPCILLCKTDRTGQTFTIQHYYSSSYFNSMDNHSSKFRNISEVYINRFSAEDVFKYFSV